MRKLEQPQSRHSDLANIKYCGYFWATSAMWGAIDKNRPQPTSSLHWTCVHGANWIQLELSGWACYTPTSWVFRKQIWYVPSSITESHSHTFHEVQKHPLSIVMFWSCAQQFLNYLAEVLSPWPPWECSGPLWRIRESITLYSCLPVIKSLIPWTLLFRPWNLDLIWTPGSGQKSGCPFIF